MPAIAWLVVAIVAGAAAYLVGWPAWQAYRARETRDATLSATWAWRGRGPAGDRADARGHDRGGAAAHLGCSGARRARDRGAHRLLRRLSRRSDAGRASLRRRGPGGDAGSPEPRRGLTEDAFETPIQMIAVGSKRTRHCSACAARRRFGSTARTSIRHGTAHSGWRLARTTRATPECRERTSFAEPSSAPAAGATVGAAHDRDGPCALFLWLSNRRWVAPRGAPPRSCARCRCDSWPARRSTRRSPPSAPSTPAASATSTCSAKRADRAIADRAAARTSRRSSASPRGSMPTSASS